MNKEETMESIGEIIQRLKERRDMIDAAIGALREVEGLDDLPPAKGARQRQRPAPQSRAIRRKRPAARRSRTIPCRSCKKPFLPKIGHRTLCKECRSKISLAAATKRTARVKASR